MLAWKFPPGKGLFIVELNYGRTKKITFGEAFSSFFFSKGFAPLAKILF